MVIEDLYISSSTFEVIQPLLIISRLFGLFPISYKKNGNTYCLKWSIIYGLYSYSLLLGLALWTMIGMVTDMKNDPKHSLRMTDEKTKFVTSGDISIVVIIVVFGTVTLHLKVKKFWKLMASLNKADTIIPFRNPKYFRKLSINFITAVLSTTTIILTFDLANWFVKLENRKRESILYLLHYVAFYILYNVIIMIEVFYWHVILLIKIRISSLNKYLIKIKNKMNFGNGNCNFEQMVGKLYLDKFNVRNLNIISSPYVSGDNSTELGKKIINLSLYQDKIFEAVKIVNNSMEFCIHLIMLSCLLHLIVTPYFLLKGFLTSDDVFYVLLQLVWLLGHIGRVLIIVEPCQHCINEHVNTSSIICELLTSEVDEELKKAMTVLSLQLNYCKLSFSSCGFFKINRSLLTSIAGAVTTYLVILFQFNDDVDT